MIVIPMPYRTGPEPPPTPRRPDWKPPKAVTIIAAVIGAVVGTVAVALALFWVVPRIHRALVAGLFASGLFKSDPSFGVEMSSAPFFAAVLIVVVVVVAGIACAGVWEEGR